MTRIRLSLLAPLFLAMPLALPAGACAASDTAKQEQSVLTDTDAGATRTVAVGQSVEVRLKAQLGTGYSWIAVPVDGLKVGTPEVTGSTGVPGAPEIQVFAVTVTSRGSHTLTFNYRQPWKNGDKSAKTVTFTITGS